MRVPGEATKNSRLHQHCDRLAFLFLTLPFPEKLLGYFCRKLQNPHCEILTCAGFSIPSILASGDVVQLVRTLPCHGRGRGFESRRPRHFFQSFAKNWQFASWSNLVQLGQCLSLVEHHPNKFALCQPLVRHTRLSVKIQRNATVRMT
jgi:hypothetical protein